MMKVLCVASEAVPFIKTGGLADVIGSLPQELHKHKVDVRVVLPLYEDIPQEFVSQMELVAELSVPVSWRQQYCGVKKLVYQGVTFYFLDNEYYFKRPGLYGYFDDAERFAWFSRAVLEMLPVLDFQPDVLHCHDWHAALAVIFLRTLYRNEAFYQGMKTLFTIHNLRYQGVFGREILGDVLGLGEDVYVEALEFNQAVNLMKGALIYADRISTVSCSYAEEIQQAYYGEGLDGLLRQRQENLEGIVNGIDYASYDPQKDAHVFVNYDADHLLARRENKARLQDRLGLPVRRDVPLVAIVSRLVAPKGLDLIGHILGELVAGEDLQVVVLGTGDAQYEKMFQQMAWDHPNKVSVNIFFDETLARQIYAAADLFLMPSQFEPCGIGQMIALRYGAIPIARETGGLKDTVFSFNKYTGRGNGFTFANYNAHDMLYTIKRALNYFYDKPVWEKIVRNAMNCDYSWGASAKKYVEVYRNLLR